MEKPPRDVTPIYYKDWGPGPVVTFSHGWPLNADAWDGQMNFLAQQGFRVHAPGKGERGSARILAELNVMRTHRPLREKGPMVRTPGGSQPW
jgi:non-heme chloroperoxidase